MDKNNLYYLVAKGTNYVMQSGGKDFIGYHYAAMRRAKEHNKEYGTEYEVMSIKEYERIFT